MRPRYELRRLDPYTGAIGYQGPTFWRRRSAVRAGRRVTRLGLWSGALVLDRKRGEILARSEHGRPKRLGELRS